MSKPLRTFTLSAIIGRVNDPVMGECVHRSNFTAQGVTFFYARAALATRLGADPQEIRLEPQRKYQG